LITLRNVEKFYEGGFGRSYVLRRINLEIQEGEFVTNHGTLGRRQIDAPEHPRDAGWRLDGEFDFSNHQVHRMKPRDRAELNKKYIGFVVPEYNLIDNLTVYENLDMPALLPQREKFRARRGRVRHARPVPHCGQARPISEPAFGRQQQLVAVARAVNCQPRLILADEPTGNLHSSQARRSWSFSKAHEEGTTIVQVTHSEANAAYGHRVVQLADGWIVERAPRGGVRKA